MEKKYSSKNYQLSGIFGYWEFLATFAFVKSITNGKNC